MTKYYGWTSCWFFSIQSPFIDRIDFQDTIRDETVDNSRMWKSYGKPSNNIQFENAEEILLYFGPDLKISRHWSSHETF